MSCYSKTQVEAKSMSSWHQNWLMGEWKIGQHFHSSQVTDFLWMSIEKSILDWPLFTLSTFCALRLFFSNFVLTWLGFSGFMLPYKALHNLFLKSLYFLTLPSSPFIVFISCDQQLYSTFCRLVGPKKFPHLLAAEICHGGQLFVRLCVFECMNTWMHAHIVAVCANLGLFFFLTHHLSFTVIFLSLLFASAAFYFNISVVGRKFVKFTKCVDHGPRISVKT